MKEQYLIRFVVVTVFVIFVVLPTVIQRQTQESRPHVHVNYMVDAWIVPTTVIVRVNHGATTYQPPHRRISMSGNHVGRSLQNQTPLQMAGFGDASSSNESKEIKLKPKQQWDRYTALKKETSVVVGVKVASAVSVEGEWLVVGAVKSESTIPTEVAVARQRALLVEV